ncbi:hypothetical protein B0I08_101322 [Glaciihabitans tibetensis]|uniref:C1q domain-containing protein n=1 Tax=Glaciihabitans tibetensis TaxID=1266600 RepID=A0A2T0VIZ6_9MICO|nr:hypothetical protein [Glaciihabitans tibetensis]PRY70194.1 hypothetical protein B0I08_101322 [Glaciihabitans tibetensis]
MPLDSRGIYKYTETEDASLVSDLLNKGMTSVSDKVFDIGAALDQLPSDTDGKMTERIAANAAQRDLIYPPPTTQVGEIALQARGASVWRSDKGWTERFYGLHDATLNPAGVGVGAGWYPESGRMPRAAQHRMSTNLQTIPVAVMTPVTFPTATRSFETTGPALNWETSYNDESGQFYFPVAGLYRVDVQINWAGTTETSRRLVQIYNPSTPGDPVTIEESRPSATNYATVSNLSATIPVGLASALYVRVYQNSPSPVNVYGRVAFTYLGVR